MGTVPAATSMSPGRSAVASDHLAPDTIRNSVRGRQYFGILRLQDTEFFVGAEPHLGSVASSRRAPAPGFVWMRPAETAAFIAADRRPCRLVIDFAPSPDSPRCCTTA